MHQDLYPTIISRQQRSLRPILRLITPFLLTMALVAVACVTSDELLTTPTPTSAADPAPTAGSVGPVSFRTIAQDAPLGAEPPVPAYVVNATPSTWQEVAEELPPEALEAGRGAAPEEIVLVAFAGSQGSSGHQITITDIWQAEGELLVTVVEERPAPEEIVEPAMTLPFHVVAVSAADIAPGTTTVRFQDENGARFAEKSVNIP